jgi:hypothetical protein
MYPKRILKLVLFFFSLLIGLWHLGIALKALFVFRNNESLLMWIFIFFGPLSTFPATLASFYWIRMGGFWLVLGGVISFLCLMFLDTPGYKTDIVQYLIKYSSPMIFLGLLALIVRNRKIWPYN